MATQARKVFDVAMQIVRTHKRKQERLAGVGLPGLDRATTAENRQPADAKKARPGGENGFVAAWLLPKKKDASHCTLV